MRPLLLALLAVCLGTVPAARAQMPADTIPPHPTQPLPETNHYAIDTPHGRLVVRLFDDTPVHRDNFKRLVQEAFYDSTTFHRVIEGFMVQGGDPNTRDADSVNDGQGDPGYSVPAEIGRFHFRGALAAARQPDQINPRRASSGSQFYIVQGQAVPPHFLAQMQDRVRQATGDTTFTYPPEAAARYAEGGGTPFLDGQYTVFGELVEGFDVLDALAAADTPRKHGQQGPLMDRPTERLWMVVRPLEGYTPPEPPGDEERPAMPPAPDAPAPEPSGVKPSRETAIEVVARRKFSLGRWDRVALYRETAEAATDTDLPFWLVLLLSGAIATLGLALDQAAVVIGAMLIAPLLGPLLGLSLALAIGDGRLAVQTAATIALGTLGVIAVAAALTVLLPFQNVTPEILARTRPTTLDLAIAVASGLAGAVVTVSREKRLSASIPGVAIAVALIPPLGVAGFGIGAGMQGSLVYGSLLLFGANLGGIVLSGMLVFLLVGLHRPDVVEAARRWHREDAGTGLAARIDRSRLFRRVRVFGSTWARVGLVCAFVGAVAVPLSSSLQQFIRETRVERAVDGVAAALRREGRAAVLSREVALGDGRTTVRFRVATADWIGEDERRALERTAASGAGEPVELVLDQLVSSDESLESLVAAAAAAFAAQETTPRATLARLQTQVGGVLARLALPDSVAALGAEVAFGAGVPRVEVTYAAPRPLPPEAAAMLARQAAGALGLDPAAVSTRVVLLEARPLPVDSAAAAETAALFARYPALLLRLTADSAAVAAARARFVEAGVDGGRIAGEAGAPPRYRYALAPPATAAAR